MRIKRECDWGCLHQWMSLLDPDFINHVTFNCNQFDHYLDAFLDKIEPFPDDHRIESGFTGIDDDMSLPTGVYIEDGTVPVIFDSGYLVPASPSKSDFGDSFKACSRTMIGPGASHCVYRWL